MGFLSLGPWGSDEGLWKEEAVCAGLLWILHPHGWTQGCARLHMGKAHTVRHFWGTDFPMMHFLGFLGVKLGERNHVALHLFSGDFTPEGVHSFTEHPFPDKGSWHLFSCQLPGSPWWLYLPLYQLATCFLDVPTQWVKSKLPSDGNTAPRQSSAT